MVIQKIQKLARYGGLLLIQGLTQVSVLLSVFLFRKSHIEILFDLIDLKVFYLVFSIAHNAD